MYASMRACESAQMILRGGGLKWPEFRYSREGNHFEFVEYMCKILHVLRSTKAIHTHTHTHAHTHTHTDTCTRT